jgi:hypothetical protein
MKWDASDAAPVHIHGRKAGEMLLNTSCQKPPWRPRRCAAHVGEFRTRTLSQKVPNLREKLTRAVRLRHEIIAARRSGFLFISAKAYDVTAMIGIELRAGSALMRRVASYPSMTGS